MNPTALSSVFAGSPVPMEDGQVFNLTDYLVRHPEQTFFVKVYGDSMRDRGIEDGDILIVDKSKYPQPSDVVIARVGDGLTVKIFQRERNRLRLVPANPGFKAIDINEDARIYGVVLFAIHKLHP